jgi:Cu2+-exporting ATPase
VFWIGDKIREDAATSLVALVRAGHRLHLLSGDHPRTVSLVGQALALSAGRSDLFTTISGGVTPEEKLARIRAFQENGQRVAMVGDGVNDTGALAAATVGIAVNGAAEASRMSADVYLSSPGVGELQDLFDGARRTLGTIRHGIVFSLVYNAIGITCAAFGFLSPSWAAVLMPVSSLTVVTNAYRSRMFLRKKSP